MKDPHWYAVQGSDTTMLPKAAALPGHKKDDVYLIGIKYKRALVLKTGALFFIYAVCYCASEILNCKPALVLVMGALDEI